MTTREHVMKLISNKHCSLDAALTSLVNNCSFKLFNRSFSESYILTSQKATGTMSLLKKRELDKADGKNYKPVLKCFFPQYKLNYNYIAPLDLLKAVRLQMSEASCRVFMMAIFLVSRRRRTRRWRWTFASLRPSTRRRGYRCRFISVGSFTELFRVCGVSFNSLYP